jgi:hypothetical protein
MLSKPLAFGLLVVACTATAGGGAYFATLQHARSSSAVAASPATPLAETSPQPVGATGTTSPAADASQALADQPPSEVAAPPAAPPSAAAGNTEKPQAKASSASRQAPGRSAKVPPLPPRAGETPSQAPIEPPPPAPASSGADPNLATQRPWPGPPVSPPALPPVISVEPGKVEPEHVSNNNVKLWEEVVVPAESVLGLQLESSISTEYARVEDRVDARVTRDVRVNGRVAIPAGTHAIGSVIMIEKGGRVKERARIGIRFNTLVLADESRVLINTDTVYREGESPANQSSAKIGGAAIGGAIIGAILGGGRGAAIGSGIGAAGGAAAAMSGDRRPVFLPAGTTLSVRTQAPVSVIVEK